MTKWLFHASFTPKIDGKVNIARKRLIVGSPGQFSWIRHVLAYLKQFWILVVNIVIINPILWYSIRLNGNGNGKTAATKFRSTLLKMFPLTAKCSWNYLWRQLCSPGGVTVQETRGKSSDKSRNLSDRSRLDYINEGFISIDLVSLIDPNMIDWL